MFTHSLPLIAAEQCYIYLLKSTRDLIINSKTIEKQQECYNLIINLIEDYNIKLLSTKIYWDKPEEKEEYKRFWDKYNNINNKKEKEILFIKYDLKKLKESKKDYEKIMNFYKAKLVEYGAIKTIKNTCKTITGRFIKNGQAIRN